MGTQVGVLGVQNNVSAQDKYYLHRDLAHLSAQSPTGPPRCSNGPIPNLSAFVRVYKSVYKPTKVINSAVGPPCETGRASLKMASLDGKTECPLPERGASTAIARNAASRACPKLSTYNSHNT